MGWTKEELDASVNAYIEMRELELRGKKFVKKRYYDDLNKRFGRSVNAFQYRMQNISHVYDLAGRYWIKGLKPAKNVGTNILPIIEELIQKNEEVYANLQAGFEEQVSKLRRKKIITKPSGNRSPAKQTAQNTSYVRDAKVAAWVLKNSQGRCETCNQQAPFIKHGGDFYLEVHHLRRLADGGSDTTTNAIAVCPNCHRELHYGAKRKSLIEEIYQQIGRLNKE